jgi:hypothetical protein
MDLSPGTLSVPDRVLAGWVMNLLICLLTNYLEPF